MCECIQRIGMPKQHQPGCLEGYPNKPHKYAALIKAWADGAEIQYFSDFYKAWLDCTPAWRLNYNYRIKPEPKPDVILLGEATLSGVFLYGSPRGYNFKMVFDGETGKLKNVEMI